MAQAQFVAPDDQALPLFDFQQDALDAILNRWQEGGIRRQIVAIPTGGGKTVLACHLIRQLGLPTVFLVHREELVTQTVKHMAEINPTLTTAVCKAEYGRTVAELQGADVVVASAQTLARENRLRVLVEAVGTGGLLIVDEAHHAMAETWAHTIEALDARLVVGLTATPKRGDGQDLGGIFEEIVHQVSLRTLVDRARLARPMGVRIGTQANLDAVHVRAGEFVERELSAICNSPERNQLVYEAWRDHADARGYKRAIAFCVDVAHVEALQTVFEQNGVPVAHVVGETPSDARRGIYQMFKSGHIKVLISCMVLTEGFDEPLADCALMARPTQSPSLYVQMAGRVLRHAPGKDSALIIDFADLTKRHELVNLWTLGGEEVLPVAAPPANEVIDLFGEVEEREARKAKVKAGMEILGDMLAQSPLHWQNVNGRPFVVAGQGTWYTVLRQDGGYIPIRLYTVPERRPSIDRLFGRPVDMETALAIAQNLAPRQRLNERDAEWREAPATPKQRDFALQLGIPVEDGWNRGDVSAAIDQKLFARTMVQAGVRQLEEARGAAPADL